MIAAESALSKPNVLVQTAKNKGSVFNVILLEDPSLKDVKVSVKMKAVAGDIDQGGGLVWRAKDAKNYYTARYNPLEENLRVYKVVDGKRRQLESADIDAAPGWHAIEIEMVGDRITCSYNGKKHLEVKDDTFMEAGLVGLWTKADAQTHFEDLEVKAGDGRREEERTRGQEKG